MNFFKNLKIILFVGLFCLMGCVTDKPEKIPGLSEIPLDYSINRFEDHLFALDTSNMIDALYKLEQDNQAFSPIYFTQVLPTQKAETQFEFYDAIKVIINDKFTQNTYNAIKDKFGDFGVYKKEFDDAFKRYKHYFPGKREPNIYTFLSDFGYQCFIFEDGDRDGIGIGLDLFLHPELEYKKIDARNPAFSDYLMISYTKEQMTKRVMEQLVDDMMGPVKGNKMIDHMIHQGKKIYILSKLLPNKKEAVWNDYADKEMQWVKENELGIWTFFLDQEILYATKLETINRYIQPAPTSRNMPAESPGKTGAYLGYKIVESYMNKYSDHTLQNLIVASDGTKFLQDSRYKPRK